MPVYRIQATRTEFHLIECYVRARDADEAESMFYACLQDDGPALLWNQNFGGSETEIDSVEAAPSDHEVVLADSDRSRCLYCGRPVTWTGVRAQDSPHGRPSRDPGFT